MTLGFLCFPRLMHTHDPLLAILAEAPASLSGRAFNFETFLEFIQDDKNNLVLLSKGIDQLKYFTAGD